MGGTRNIFVKIITKTSFLSNSLKKSKNICTNKKNILTLHSQNGNNTNIRNADIMTPWLSW